MSAIWGVCHFDGQTVTADASNALQQALAAFGPDGGKTWASGTVAMGHHLWQVAPESPYESQPWHDAISGLTLVADARLDNRGDLLAAFGLSRSRGAICPDSQLILRAYQQWGADCANKLRGDFAFAIWDERARQLFCARDIFGVKPFYYHTGVQRVVWASSLHAVLAVPGMSRELDDVALAALLRRHQVPLARTWHRAVRKLSPGHAMLVNPTGCQSWAYWDPRQSPELHLPSEADYVDGLRDLVQRAVADRVRSIHPIGAHLSGGLDSSAIAAMAARQLRARGESLTAFSWSPPPDPTDTDWTDERARVQAVCHQEDIPCYYTPVQVYQTVWDSLTPLDHPPPFRQEAWVRQQARSRGIRVLLSGWGGDELATFNGRGYLTNLFRRGRWWHMLRLCREYRERYGHRVRGQLFNNAILPLVPDALLRLLPTDQLPPYMTDRHELPALLQTDVAQRLSQVHTAPERLLRSRVGGREMQLALLAHGHLTERIDTWTAAGLSQGVEYRYPFLDRRVVEFCLGLPPEMYFNHGWKRYLFRRAMEGILPPALQWHTSKREPAHFDAFKTCRIAHHQHIIVPLLSDLLRDRTAFAWLDAARLRAWLPSVTHVDDPEAMQQRVQASGVVSILRLEMMLNPALAAHVQARLQRLPELAAGASSGAPDRLRTQGRSALVLRN
jgi:asparagine synthase (glutamine-hydrolysing)